MRLVSFPLSLMMVASTGAAALAAEQSMPATTLLAMAASDAAAVPASDTAAKPTVPSQATATAPGGTFPQITFNGRVYAEYGYQTSDTGRLKKPAGAGFNQFDITRAMVMMEGRTADWLSFYTELDVSRPNDITVSGSDVASAPGRLFEYLRTADVEFSHFGLPNGRLRAGLTALPYASWEDGVYGYRVQSKGLAERENTVGSRDFGLSLLGDVPGNWGDFHIGVYNGTVFNPETVASKNPSGRLTLTPFKALGFAPLRPVALTGWFSLFGPAPSVFGTLLTYKEANNPLTLAVGTMNDTDKKGRAQFGLTGFGTLRLGGIHPVLAPVELVVRADRFIEDQSIANIGRTQLVTGIAYYLQPKSKLMIDNEAVFYDDAAKPMSNVLFAHLEVNF